MNLRLATHACGTRFELVLATEPGIDERRLRSVGEEALELIEEVDRNFSLFRSDSLLAHINREAPRRPVSLDQDSFELLRAALGLWRDSEGAFDPGLAGRMRAAGFQPDSCLGETQPDAAAPGAAAMELDGERRTIRFGEPGVVLDLGGIAKGHALDLAADSLRAAGVRRALLQGGTSAVVALGAPPDMPGWPIALERRGGPRICLCDCALALSWGGSQVNGDGSGHVLDPLRGGSAPTRNATCVVARTARTADGWATALVVRPELKTKALKGSVATLGLSSGPPHARAWRFFEGTPQGQDFSFHVEDPRIAPALPTACPLRP